VDQNIIADPMTHVDHEGNGKVKGRHQGWLDFPVSRDTMGGWDGNLAPEVSLDGP